MKHYAPLLALALATGTAMAAPVMANDAPPTVGVEFADLNLATESGQSQLARRIEAAAREVCGIQQVRTGTMLQSKAARTCYTEAKANLERGVATRTARLAAVGASHR